VKDLEAKIATLRASQKETEEEKKKLQQDLAKAYTENANLRFAPPSPKSEC
jgi:chaperonin cofactor prefoldin